MLGVLLRFLAEGRGATLREGARDLRQRLGNPGEDAAAALAGRPVLWVHTASLGEAAAAAPLLAALPGSPGVLLTSSTVAGRGHGARLKGVAAAALAPVDAYPAVARFLDRVRPRSLVLVETELWPMILWLARRRGVRLGIANGRITPRSFARYRWIRGAMAGVLSGIERAAVQTEADAERFAALGVPRAALAVTGNVKYDAAPPSPASVAESRAVLDGLGWTKDGYRVWVAGSSRPGAEEDALLTAFEASRRAHPGLRLVLAPRHIERSGEVAELLGRRGILFSRLSAAPGPGAECLLVDVMGRLGGFYGCGDLAFVGGTLVPVGGHNLLEPALCGLPVLFGPHTESIVDPARDLESSGGGFRVPDAAALAGALARLLVDPQARAQAGRRARQTAERYRGATQRTLDHLAPLLTA